MAIKGKTALEEFGKTIDDAVSQFLTFLRTEKAKDESQTISAMANLWLDEKKNKTRRNTLRPATLNDIVETNKILRRNFGHLKILEASKKHFEEYLNGLNVGEQRRYNLRSRFSHFFNWCIHELDIPMKNWKLKKPAQKLSPSPRDIMPQTLPPTLWPGIPRDTTCTTLPM